MFMAANVTWRLIIYLLSSYSEFDWAEHHVLIVDVSDAVLLFMNELNCDMNNLKFPMCITL